MLTPRSGCHVIWLAWDLCGEPRCALVVEIEAPEHCESALPPSFAPLTRPGHPNRSTISRALVFHV